MSIEAHSGEEVREYWGEGLVETQEFVSTFLGKRLNTPSLQYSITPSLHQSNAPSAGFTDSLKQAKL
jgi:hypothetical protein